MNITVVHGSLTQDQRSNITDHEKTNKEDFKRKRPYNWNCEREAEIIRVFLLFLLQKKSPLLWIWAEMGEQGGAAERWGGTEETTSESLGQMIHVNFAWCMKGKKIA